MFDLIKAITVIATTLAVIAILPLILTVAGFTLLAWILKTLFKMEREDEQLRNDNSS